MSDGTAEDEQRWSPGTIIARGLLYVVLGGAIAWWAWPEPTDSAAMALFVYAGLLMALGGLVMSVYGVVRGLTRVREQ